MKLEVAKKIVEAAEDLGLEGVSLHEDYSGRGMYGKKTAGVVYSELSSLLQAIAHYADGANDDEMDELLKELDVDEDSMGFDRIIY